MKFLKKVLRPFFYLIPLRIRRLFFKIYNSFIYFITRGRNIKWCEFAAETYVDADNYCVGVSIDREDDLGDYKFIRDEIVKKLAKDKVVLEIGCLDGKWSVPICQTAKHAYLCDLEDVILKALSNRLKSYDIPDDLWTWKKINGKNLDCIPSKSIDFVFSIDTLVRVPKKAILKYLEDTIRILKDQNSIAMIHLPIYECKYSRAKRFTNLKIIEVVNLLDKYSVNYSFKNMLKLGRFLFITPEKKFSNINSSKLNFYY